LTHADVRQIRAEPRVPQKNLPIKHVIPGDGSSLSPASIDIGTFIFVTHELAVAVDATIRGKNPCSLIRCTRVSLRRNGARVGIFIGLDDSESHVRVCYKTQPANSK
jgi:hypothetical protein